ncbi:hypothetical protein HPB49_011031 [Dermacentor silvarum]|uniref:Uncharacterized protein n=1 Tax=Dermacentor silvarum TaxID=543639 RepID=A0ACB8CWM3_DERSI|nr:hypothetical protein HPB49_011031 [Dermacentor silvarum]
MSVEAAEGNMADEETPAPKKRALSSMVQPQGSYFLYPSISSLIAPIEVREAVCNQSRSLCEAVCNLAYGAHGVLAQTTTEAMLGEIREYHVQLLDYEARLIAACCDYAAVHVLVQIRISRSHKFSVLASGSQLVVNSIAGKGTLPLGGFA